MYRQKKWSEEDKDQALKDEILAIRREHKDYGYRRIHLELKNRGWAVNKKKVQRLSKHVEKRQLLRQRNHEELLQRLEKRNLCRPLLSKSGRTRGGHRTLYPQLQQRSNQRKVRRSESETIPWTHEIRIENKLCKIKSSKRNAYTIKPNFMGSLYRK